MVSVEFLGQVVEASTIEEDLYGVGTYMINNYLFSVLSDWDFNNFYFRNIDNPAYIVKFSGNVDLRRVHYFFGTYSGEAVFHLSFVGTDRRSRLKIREWLNLPMSEAFSTQNHYTEMFRYDI